MKLGITIIIGLCFVFVVGVYARERCKPLQLKTVYVADPNQILNIYEIQQRLIDQGFGWPIVDGQRTELKVDGKWQRITEAAYCDYCAVREFRRIGE